MTDGAPFQGGSRNQLREDAAQWFARMRGTDAEQHRDAFERWLAMGALHRQAYNSIAEIWALGKGLDAADTASAVPGPSSGSIFLPLAIAASLLLVGLGIGWRWSLSRSPSPIPEVVANFQAGDVATEGAVRQYKLPDGTVIRLDPATALTFVIGPSARSVTVKRGRVRFAVVHDRRQFMVHAGGGTIIDRGTVFDVSLRGGSVLVHLIEGSVEVRSPLGRPRTREDLVLRPAPGGTVTYAASSSTSRARAVEGQGALLELDGVRLADVLAAADRFPGAPVVLADQALGDIRVSGTVRVDDHARLARHLGNLLGLNSEEDADVIRLGSSKQKPIGAR